MSWFTNLFRQDESNQATKQFKVLLRGQPEANWCCPAVAYDMEQAAEMAARVLYDTKCDLIVGWPLHMEVIDEDGNLQPFLVHRKTLVTYVAVKPKPADRRKS